MRGFTERIQTLVEDDTVDTHARSSLRYLKNRMLAIAPNLTAVVGELIGARLISHAGSLLNLSKHPGKY